MGDHWDSLFDEAYHRRIEPSDLAAQQDTLYERAVPARRILIQLAEHGQPGDETLVTRKRNTTTYGKLAEEVESDASYIPKVLGIIDLVGDELGEPPLSALVESSDTVGPGRGYFNWEFHGEDRIRIDSDKQSLTPKMKQTWREHLRTVYEHDNWYRPE